MRFVLAIMVSLVLAACSPSADDGVVDVAFITASPELRDEGVRLDFAGQHLRASRAQGLVRTDPAGQIIPAIAERWIVTDDGESYIFRIREFDLPDGSRLTAPLVRNALQRRLRELRTTSLGLDLAKVRDVRAMTGRVVEIRLNSPMPDFLQLLAQPELGIDMDRIEAGLMTRTDREGVLALSPIAPEMRGLPKQPGWEDEITAMRVYAESASAATEGFAQGRFDVILGGRLVDLPLASTGPLSRGNVRLDPAIGLLGLDVRNTSGLLSTSENREALAMAIDREALIQPFNIGGWVPSTRIVPVQLAGAEPGSAERWAAFSLEQRRAQAGARVSQWESATGNEASVRIELPEGPGSELLFEGLARDFQAIGVAAIRAEAGEPADLSLRDRVARYASPRWFLNQFNCRISARQCSRDVDDLVALALDARDPAEEASYLAEAEATLLATNLYIPLGAPVRWSMVRADIDAFSENPWNIHPLFPLSRAPI